MDDTDSPPFHPDSPVLDDEGNPLPYDKPGHYEKEEDPQQEGVSISTMDMKTVSVHRKAFVKWVNEELYPRVIRSGEESSLKVYQRLVQTYLGLQTPYRGVLVYHGLGTGKTATAVTLAEGLSSTLKIHTLLPASLETEFIKEVRQWGLAHLHIHQRWCLRPFKELTKSELQTLKELYGITATHINKILRLAKTSIKKRVIQDSDETDAALDAQIRASEKQIQSLKGVWLPEDSPLAKDTDDYKHYPDPKKPEPTDSWDSLHQEYILQQVNYLISLKYNFIHYRPFPKVDESDIPEFQEVDEVLEDMVEEEEDHKERRTHNQAMVKQFEKSLRYNQKHFDIDSPFHNEVIIVDEVHNFVRQILNDSKPSRVFYEWIINARDVKVVFLSGTPVINKPCEIAILYNMLYGLIRIYTFTITTDKTPEILTALLTDTLFKKPTSIELFHVVQKEGQCLVSFIQEQTGFESLRDPENPDESVVYTIQTQDSDFDTFMKDIYQGFKDTLSSKDKVCPSQETYDALTKKQKRDIYRGQPSDIDKECAEPFQKQQTLFDIDIDGQLVDMTDNEQFMRYFFESGDLIPREKKTLLKRMLMGLTSYYPIDRSSIVDMPRIVKPTFGDTRFQDYTIVKDMNIVTCGMSQIQFEKYNEVWESESSMDKSRRINENEDSPYHYKTRTRQSCNIIFRQDDFRMIRETESNKQQLLDEKQRVYQELLESGALRKDRDLRSVSPKMYMILEMMKPFVNDKDHTSTGKVLFYSDFRADAGSESFELVLLSNGYEKFDSKKPQDTPGLRYTFITGAEDTEERRINKEYYNADINKHGEYIQIMIISSAGAEGLSLTCVRQVHLLEPYWNYVRLDQVLGRAIRMRSHITLEKQDRNVEQYLYLSVLPEGTHIETVYDNVKREETWSIPDWSDLREALSKTENKSYKDLLESLVNINLTENEMSTDQSLFQVMERKYKASLEISNVIKESSLDCIPHTRDNPQLNDRCVRFSDTLIGEISYFPGVSAKLLETIDVTQLRANTLIYLPPNIYVVSGTAGESHRFVYYEYNLQKEESREDIDIRYLRDNGTRILDLFMEEKMAVYFVDGSHPHDELFGKEFSVYQELYSVEEEMLDVSLEKDTMPTLDALMKSDSLQGYKLKYNINQTYYYIHAPLFEPGEQIIKMYPYTEFQEDNYTTDALQPVILYDEALYLAS